MEGQLRKLRKGIHPKIGAALLPAVELDLVIPPTRSNTVVDEHKPPDGFYQYVPVSLPTVVPSSSGGGPSTSERQMALLERIRAKERTMRTDVATREPRATSCPSGSSTDMVAHCPARSVALDTAGGTADWCTTNGGNDCSAMDASENGRPWEPCATWASSKMH